ncbi:STAS domain-containing protein [Nocardia asteroides]|uniref:STAS domain-containing protein n=1 Tax=Nocardia asteroides TaxID=1824 RepID=UPI001E595B3F|nr:STAS domain-containing protein [Nocardia asteroides]UGT60440.1 STAS domain-containing protein [Nocardia asteroides]
MIVLAPPSQPTAPPAPAAKRGSPADRLRVAVTHPGAALTLCAVAGAVDGYTAEIFARRLGTALDLPAPLVAVDLSKVTFFGSAGLRALLDIRAELAESGRALCLVACAPGVERLLAVAPVEPPVRVVPDLAAAAALAARTG